MSEEQLLGAETARAEIAGREYATTYWRQHGTNPSVKHANTAAARFADGETRLLQGSNVEAKLRLICTANFLGGATKYLQSPYFAFFGAADTDLAALAVPTQLVANLWAKVEEQRNMAGEQVYVLTVRWGETWDSCTIKAVQLYGPGETVGGVLGTTPEQEAMLKQALDKLYRKLAQPLVVNGEIVKGVWRLAICGILYTEDTDALRRVVEVKLQRAAKSTHN